MTVRIVQASTAAEVAAARSLLEEYAASLGIDLGFQDFATELASLPGDYVPPRGALLLALDGETALGCVALRPHRWPEVAELKRLYVRPAGRGQALGRRLTQRALEVARQAGYRCVRLDTLPTMAAAQRLYETLGFEEIEAYRFNPVSGTRFMEAVLDAPAEGDRA